MNPSKFIYTESPPSLDRCTDLSSLSVRLSMKASTPLRTSERSTSDCLPLLLQLARPVRSRVFPAAISTRLAARAHVNNRFQDSNQLPCESRRNFDNRLAARARNQSASVPHACSIQRQKWFSSLLRRSYSLRSPFARLWEPHRTSLYTPPKQMSDSPTQPPAFGPDSSKSDGTHSTTMDPVPLVYIENRAQLQRLAGLITCKKVTNTRSDAEDRRLKERATPSLGVAL